MNSPETPPTTRREQMYALIERYLSSDQTQIEFCQAESISRSTFAYWLKRYRQDKADGSVPAFRPIPIRPGSLSARCEFEFPDGLLLRIYTER